MTATKVVKFSMLTFEPHFRHCTYLEIKSWKTKQIKFQQNYLAWRISEYVVLVDKALVVVHECQGKI